MERRVFLAIFLSFIVLVIYQTQFAPAPPPPAIQQSSSTGATGALPAGSPTPTPTGVSGGVVGTDALATGSAPTQPASQATPAAKVVLGDSIARPIIVETDSIVATFNTRGAVLTSYRLKHDRDSAGAPLDLIPSDLPNNGFDRPFTLSTDNKEETATLASALFRPSADGMTLGADPGTLTFEYRDESGLLAKKSFTFQDKRQPYLLDFEATVDSRSGPRPVTVAFGPLIGLGYSPEGQRFTAPRGIQSLNGSIQWLSLADVQTQGRYEGPTKFAGVDDQYFLAVALPSTPTARIDYVPVTVPVPGNTQGAMRTFIAFSLLPPPGATTQAVKSAFFIGPKKFDQLRAADAELTRAIEFGMFRVIVVPLLQALIWVHGVVSNWGWSIVVLTILINIIIFPLRHRSMVSMKKMQAIQPQVKAIQDRYAKYKVTDPERQKMNTEMLALYKQKGVHPASGCLPMLLTMPILLAFYALLSHAIELRGAPFIGWIHDLSMKDPTYVWPIMMGATMFWQQRMMPTTADPMQAKIFMFMPVIFTLMFLSVPSGLVVYWLVSNLLTIGQQYITNRIISTGGKGGGGTTVPPLPRTVPALKKG